jgi:hypothetical protein
VVGGLIGFNPDDDEMPDIDMDQHHATVLIRCSEFVHRAMSSSTLRVLGVLGVCSRITPTYYASDPSSLLCKEGIYLAGYMDARTGTLRHLNSPDLKFCQNHKFRLFA